MVFQFGKYRGKRAEDVPSGYLRWVLKEVLTLSYEEAKEIEYILSKRVDPDKLRRGWQKFMGYASHK